MAEKPATLLDLKVEFDPELRQIAVKEGFSSDDVVRRACLLLETRVRQVAGLESQDSGTDLIHKAFGQGGIFDSASPVKAENIGLLNLFLGVVMYYRNPVSHRAVGHSREDAIHVFNLINHLLHLLQKVSSTRVRARDYVGYHEGRITNRRDFSLDIDGDGEDELLLLLSVGPVFVKGTPESRLLPVILKKNANVGYQRIPCEIASTIESMYGAINVRLHSITNQSHPDIVTMWAYGETQIAYHIFRYDSNRYLRVDRDVAGLPEAYGGASSDCFLYHDAYKHIQFTDYDGDGLVEIVQRLGFSFDFDWKDLPEKRQQTRSRVWKWDANASQLKCILDVEIGPGWD